MADLKSSLKRHRRQNNMCNDDNRASLKLKEKNIGPYEIEKFLKEGSSSKIFLAKSKYTGENVIIKVLSKSRLKSNLDELLLITKQMESLKILKHRNIVSLYEIYESSKNFYFITEYLSGKDLIEKLIKKKRFTEEEALRIFFQLLDAMTYMHKMNICHRNIRTEHILFDKNNRPKIIGFGYSSFYEKNKNIDGSYGSLCYACPEIINDSPYNPELADVWSLGVILYVLICGYLPFSDDDDNKNKILIEKAKIDFPKEISNKLKDLIRHMLDKNPSKRYNFQKIAKHPWIKPYSESLFSGGVNIHKNIFPVDERLLNIINQYGFEKEKIKKDLINNKYNIGTGVFKQIVRKLLDLKMKNISDLYSEEFLEYKEDQKNEYKEGEKKYQNFIKKVDEKYKKIEDFINNFKEREDLVAEKLLYIKEKKENQLTSVEEKKEDSGEEDNNNDEEKDMINEMENNENKRNNIDSIRRVKSYNMKAFSRTKTANYNFRELIQGKRGEIINKNNLLDDNINPNNIEIIYNKDEEVDIIQQFQEEQNKKISENLNNESSENNEKKFLRKNSSTPNLLQDKDSNSNVANIKKFLILSVTPKKNRKDNLVKKLLNKSGFNLEIKDKKDKSVTNDTNISSSLNDNYKNIYSGNVENMNRGLVRMTSTRKSKKQYLDRGSFLDVYLKKNHPDNIRKTILKENRIYDSNIEEIKEGVKENDESDIENNSNDKNNIEEKNEKEKERKNNIRTSKNLKYSLNFDDDDEDEEENEEDDKILNNRYSIGDSNLFHMFDNEENDEELKELKRIYFHEDEKEEKEDKNNDKDNEKEVDNKDKKKLNKSKFKDKSIKNPNNNRKKVSFNVDNEYSNLKVSEIVQKESLKDDIDEETGRLRIDSQLEISFHDEVDGKFRCNLYEVYNNYINDKELISKFDYINNNMLFNINDINHKYKSKYIYSIIEDKPIKKVKINNKNESNIFDINKKNNYKNGLINIKNKETKKNNNEKIKEIPFQEGRKKLINSSNYSKKKLIVNDNDGGKNEIIKKDKATQTNKIEDDNLQKMLNKKMKEENERKINNLKKCKQVHFYIKAKYKKPNLNSLNERSYYNYNNIDNSSDYDDNELDNSKSSTFNKNNNNEFPFENNLQGKNNFFYSNISYDKRDKLIIPRKPNIIPRNKIKDDLNNNCISAFTDKRIKNYIHLPYIKYYNNNNFDSSNVEDKNNNTYIKINKKQKINNYYTNVPRRSDFYINNKFNVTSEFNKKYKDNKINLDESSLTSKKKKNYLDKFKEIKAEYLITKKDLKEKIDKCNKYLNINNIYNKHLMTYLKTNYKNNKDKIVKNNNSGSIVPNKSKNDNKNIEIHEKLNYNNDNNDNSLFKITTLFDENNFKENSKVKNNIKNKFLNKNQKVLYKKINIGFKEKLNDKNYINQINNKREKDKRNNYYYINSLPENYVIHNRGSEIIGNNYGSINKNHILNNNKYNNYSYNQNNNFNYDNYYTEEIKPSYNKKKIVLYKNSDEHIYLSNNSQAKGMPIINISLEKYMNRINDISQNKSFD